MYGSGEYSEATAGQAFQQQQLYEPQSQQHTQQFEIQQQQQTLASFEQTSQYEQPPTPAIVTRVRVTRARVRAAQAAANPPGL